MIGELVDEEFQSYHNGSTITGRHAKKPPIEERQVIAWDMEGMNLSGDNKPQHPVIFGSSLDPENEVLIGKKLSSMDMLNCIIQTGESNPHAIHVGYGFRYDANMMLQDFPTFRIRRLWKDNVAKFNHDGHTWIIRWYPGKMFTVTKRWGKGRHQKTTVTIYDFSSFFGGSPFVNVAEELLRNELTREDKEVIAHGKQARGSNTWDDLSDVLFYWRAEIRIMERVFSKFRDVMCQAGFALKDWYGPGALANYINARFKIRPHLGAVQSTSGYMPDAVHEASKVAFSGGRFEPFQLGRVRGPINAIDINSAYPYALTMLPSLHPDNGEWRHVERPRQTRRFGIYRISFRADNTGPFETRPMPLFYRDHRGLITYPNRVHGWYYSPEARMVMGMPGVTVHEGWEWHCDETERPWEFLHEMYSTRQRLGKENLLSLPFKLGPNSLYGKYAQTVGWNQKDKTPPKSHALPIAGWVTSYCRSMLWSIIRQNPSAVIAVETDSVYTTADLSTYDIELGNGLGQWGADQYDEIVYVQSGMYHTKRDGEWKGVRSRGMSRAEFSIGDIETWLSNSVPGQDWDNLHITTKPKFIGAGAALASAAPFKTQHCVWRPEHREISFGLSGKRRHSQEACAQCREGHSPWDSPHRTVIQSPSDGNLMSFPRRLPWEQDHTAEVKEIRRNLILEGDRISA